MQVEDGAEPQGQPAERMAGSDSVEDEGQVNYREQVMQQEGVGQHVEQISGPKEVAEDVNKGTVGTAEAGVGFQEEGANNATEQAVHSAKESHSEEDSAGAQRKVSPAALSQTKATQAGHPGPADVGLGRLLLEQRPLGSGRIPKCDQNEARNEVVVQAKPQSQKHARTEVDSLSGGGVDYNKVPIC